MESTEEIKLAPTKEESDLIWWEAYKVKCFAREGSYCGIRKTLCNRNFCYTRQVRGEI